MLVYFIDLRKLNIKDMKRIIIIYIFIFGLIGCNKTNIRVSELSNQLDSLKKENKNLQHQLNEAKNIIIELSNTPSVSLSRAKQLISSDKIDSAKIELNNIITKHPFSTEIKEANEILLVIQKEEKEQKEKEEKIKALGFKIFNSISSFSLNNVKYSIGNLSFNKDFTFDHCLDVGEYHYRTADKDATYLQGGMSITNKNKNNHSWNISLKLYRLENGRLEYTGYFTQEYSTWRTYGAMIGNYSDDSHDFDKVNTINYKIASEVEKKYINLPLFIVTKKSENESIKDDAEITPDVLDKNFIVIKVINKNKI